MLVKKNGELSGDVSSATWEDLGKLVKLLQEKPTGVKEVLEVLCDEKTESAKELQDNTTRLEQNLWHECQCIMTEMRSMEERIKKGFALINGRCNEIRNRNEQTLEMVALFSHHLEDVLEQNKKFEKWQTEADQSIKERKQKSSILPVIITGNIDKEEKNQAEKVKTQTRSGYRCRKLGHIACN